MEFKITKKQGQFLKATEDEVLFGGAAGGGKSYGQLIDALYFAISYKGSRQLILRRTFPELNRSLLQVSLTLFPTSIASYNKSDHLWRFANGSTIELGYCDNESDVVKYQSAEYDVIRFDELTHFTEFQYAYLISRNRGANDFPKQIKSTTNPGGVGHSWVKKRFVDVAPPLTPFTDPQQRQRLFIPAVVQDNHFLMSKDSGYLRRLEGLPRRERLALLEGCWDIFDGQYFDNFLHQIHVIPTYTPTGEDRLYCSMDYGLDMFACLFGAVQPSGKVIIFGEIYQSGLLASSAAALVKKAMEQYPFSGIFAPPDLWGSSGQNGKSIADMFARGGVPLQRISPTRISGWLAIKEALEVDQSGECKLYICQNCQNLIRTLPQLLRDKINPNDTANNPHELTHAPDALRYLFSGLPTAIPTSEVEWQQDFFERDYF